MRNTDRDSPAPKPLRFAGNAPQEISEMPLPVKTKFGYDLRDVQNGETPASASPFEGSRANEVMKLTARHDGDTYRCVYAAKFPKAVYCICFKRSRIPALLRRRRTLIPYSLVMPRLMRITKQHLANPKKTERKAAIMTTKSQVTFEESSGNVFTDFGIPNADEHLVKADLAGKIRQLLRARGLTQTEAARLLGTSQARISELYNGKVAAMTYDRLLGWLNALGNDVQITVVTLRADDPRQRGRTLISA